MHKHPPLQCVMKSQVVSTLHPIRVPALEPYQLNHLHLPCRAYREPDSLIVPKRTSASLSTIPSQGYASPSLLPSILPSIRPLSLSPASLPSENATALALVSAYYPQSVRLPGPNVTLESNFDKCLHCPGPVNHSDAELNPGPMPYRSVNRLK